jgi:hypothetical protein
MITSFFLCRDLTSLETNKLSSSDLKQNYNVAYYISLTNLQTWKKFVIHCVIILFFNSGRSFLLFPVTVNPCMRRRKLSYRNIERFLEKVD